MNEINIYNPSLSSLNEDGLKQFIDFAKSYSDEYLPQAYVDAALKDAHECYATIVFSTKAQSLKPPEVVPKKKVTKKKRTESVDEI